MPINPGHCAFEARRHHEAETVSAIDRAEGRHVEHFVCAQLRAEARVIQQITVALAEGVVDLDHDGAQAAVGAVAVPETHRFEREAPHPGVAMQPDFTIRIQHAMAR